MRIKRFNYSRKKKSKNYGDDYGANTMATMKQMMMMDVLVIHVEVIETICDGDLCVPTLRSHKKRKTHLKITLKMSPMCLWSHHPLIYAYSHQTKGMSCIGFRE
ncbi:hypothetical protein YC2023_053060 [Brassica napus]